MWERQAPQKKGMEKERWLSLSILTYEPYYKDCKELHKIVKYEITDYY